MVDPKCPPACEKTLDTMEKDIDGHRKTLYGADGMAGLVSCVGRSVKRGQLAVTIIAVVAIVATFVIYTMGSYAGEKEKRTTNTTEIRVIKEGIKHIKEDQQEIKTEQREIKADIKEIKKSMVKTEDLDLKFKLLLKAIEKKN